ASGGNQRVIHLELCPVSNTTALSDTDALKRKILTQFISHRLCRDENLKGSTVTARACLMGANLIDAGGL
ncbi:MAG: hypothetical protein PVH85_15985, partial [Desulfobacterales bacterium]